MIRRNNKKLYESIMKDVSKIVKKHLQETVIINRNDIDDIILNNGDGIYLFPHDGAARFTLDVCIIKNNKFLELPEKILKDLHIYKSGYLNDPIKFRYNIGTEPDDYYGVIGPNELKSYISKIYNINKMYFVCDDVFTEDDAEIVQKQSYFTCDDIITI